METCPRAKKALNAEWENVGFSNGHIPQKALAPGMKVTSAKRGLCERKLVRLAKQFTLAELLTFATKRGVI